MVDKKAAPRKAAAIDAADSSSDAVVSGDAGDAANKQYRTTRGPLIKGVERKKHPAKANKYSAEQQIEKIRQIEERTRDGKITLKEAIGAAGVSEQTYYRWKRNGASTDSAALPAYRSADDSNTFEDLIALDAENEHLRKLLVAKLREENSSLRKRLDSK
jgi:putative transposase